MVSVTSLLSYATFRVLYSPLSEIKFPARVLILNFNPKIWASLGLSVTCVNFRQLSTSASAKEKITFLTHRDPNFVLPL